MEFKSIGFMGGGRVTRIILTALKKAGRLPGTIVVSDNNPDVLRRLKTDIPGIIAECGNNTRPVSCSLFFIALHPPVMPEALQEARSALNRDAVAVSLAPKLTIAKVSSLLGGHSKIVRMIPNAPSIVNKGYNPIVFSEGVSQTEKETLLQLFHCLGHCPEVAEPNLEAYAIIAAMGPTYFWFQCQIIAEMGRTFGLTQTAADEAVFQMLLGSAQTMFDTSLAPQEVIDLIPVRPLAEDEESIRNIYRRRLNALYAKLKG